jgi:selenide,water dikinase
MVSKKMLKQNSTAQQGDLIFLTKPVGVGILSTSSKRGALEPAHEQEMIQWLTKLNSIGKDLAGIPGVHAMTDVTGFGLMGHLIEMCEGSGLSATLQYNKVSLINGVQKYIQLNMVPDATYRNWNGYSAKVKFEKGVNVMEAFKVLPDPQTNGGIMIAVAPSAAEEVIDLMKQQGMEAFAAPIGTFITTQEKTVIVE